MAGKNNTTCYISTDLKNKIIMKIAKKLEKNYKYIKYILTSLLLRIKCDFLYWIYDDETVK